MKAAGSLNFELPTLLKLSIMATLSCQETPLRDISWAEHGRLLSMTVNFLQIKILGYKLQ